MPTQKIFRWRDGRGWLVFAGGADSAGTIRGQTLGKAAADGAVACVALSRDPAAPDHLLDDMEDLGAPSGYLVDVESEDDATLRDRLGEAGVIVITSDAYAADGVRSILTGAALDGIAAAYANGAVVLLEGPVAAAFGAFLLWTSAEGDPQLGAGFGWLADVLVLPLLSPDEISGLLTAQPDAFALQLGVGSALALGPDGEVELWGRRQNIIVTIGPSYQLDRHPTFDRSGQNGCNEGET